ncbi:MAG: rhodanese-like domain-containing protein [Syntrophomonadaceae bacterium]|jgi:rhodanese-related sulfurtransferase|nr:rhodanese-like domain-containing protein [Syntrophomonadaceae bacterium]
MNSVIRDACREFTAGLHAHGSYMVEMADAKPRMEAREGGLVIVDIRPSASYQLGHIPGSINLPLADLVDGLSRLPLDRPLYIVCRLDAMSAYATALLRLLGYDAWLVQGGVPAWTEAGGKLEKG